MKDGSRGGSLIGHPQNLGGAGELQRNGTGKAGVPDHKSGIGGGDEQRIVHVTDPTGDLFGKQSAGDEAEAPVEPAADGGHEGGDEDGALFILGQRGNGA